jgi:hypothetical protein
VAFLGLTDSFLPSGIEHGRPARVGGACTAETRLPTLARPATTAHCMQRQHGGRASRHSTHAQHTTRSLASRAAWRTFIRGALNARTPATCATSHAHTHATCERWVPQSPFHNVSC